MPAISPGGWVARNHGVLPGEKRFLCCRVQSKKRQIRDGIRFAVPQPTEWQRIGKSLRRDNLYGVGRGAGVERCRGVGVHLPVHGVGVGVEVGVAVSVAVAIGVAVAVGRSRRWRTGLRAVLPAGVRIRIRVKYSSPNDHFIVRSGPYRCVTVAAVWHVVGTGRRPAIHAWVVSASGVEIMPDGPA